MLSDNNYSVTGTGKGAFLNDVSKLSRITHEFEIMTDGISLYTVETFQGKKIIGKRHKDGESHEKSISKDLFLGDEITGEELDRLIDEEMLLAEVDGSLFVMASNSLVTLAQRAGQTCGLASRERDRNCRFYRDGGYEAYFRVRPELCKILFRQEENVRKIWAIFSEKYMYVDQSKFFTEVMDIFSEKFGRVDVCSYEINNFYTDVYCEFPSKEIEMDGDYIIPGVRLHTSDVGESSIMVDMTISVRNNGHVYIPGGSIRMEHSDRQPYTAAFVKDKLEEQLFSAYKKSISLLQEAKGKKTDEKKLFEMLKKSSISRAAGMKRMQDIKKNLKKEKKKGAINMETVFDAIAFACELTEEIQIPNYRGQDDLRYGAGSLIDEKWL